MDRVRQSTDARTLVHLLTGFLGSGKTSLLQRHLAGAADEGIAVLINEFGEVGLDHRLVTAGDATVHLLENGCLCCGVAPRLRDCVRALLAQRKRQGGAPFRTLIIETSGLACPEPILNTLRSDYALNEYLRVGTIVTTLDAVNGASALARYSEAARQLCAADCIVVTKADLVEPRHAAALIADCRALNPLATIQIANSPAFRPASLFDSTADRVLPRAGGDVPALHAASFRSFTLTYQRPLDWARFSLWLTALLNRHGGSVLRFKGILEVSGQPRPVVIHGVQHLMYPPRHLRCLPEGQQGSSMVFIVDGIEPERIVRSLHRFMDDRVTAIAA